MRRKLYQEISQCLRAVRLCRENKNDGWRVRWEDRLQELQSFLPSGSGVDSGSKILIDDCEPNRIVISADFHHMNDVGYYDGWTHHTVVVTPDLADGFNLRITGRNRNDIKDYLAEIFDYALSEEILISRDGYQSMRYGIGYDPILIGA